jgi:hypothetical protein
MHERVSFVRSNLFQFNTQGFLEGEVEDTLRRLESFLPALQQRTEQRKAQVLLQLAAQHPEKHVNALGDSFESMPR